MALFSNKKPDKSDIPLSQVSSMKSQNLDNNRIIQTLQRDGYSSAQIFEAMNEVETNTMNGQGQVKSDEIVQEQNNPQISDSMTKQPVQEPVEPVSDMSQHNFQSSGFKQPIEPMSNIPSFNARSPEVEELVESIINEKWDEIVKDISKVVEWKNSTEVKLNSLENEFKNLKEEFDKLHQAIIGKIGDYDKNILNVGAEVKAMEKVFSKVLPVFTEKVNELSDVADSIKKK